MNKNLPAVLANILNKFSLQQKILLTGSILLTAILAILLLSFLNEPKYSVLYANLAQEDASKVIDQLNADKIQYEIDNNGSTIRVPKENVYEIRLALAGKGIPSSGIVGYEIFDKTQMGMSEFMQKLNYKRALEGELARTIMQHEGVEGARVHIVTPQKSIFKNEEKAPTASVVLKLRNNFQISKNNVSAIVNLVSSSVEGLLPEKITLLDTKGRLLSKEYTEDPFAVASSKQYEIKQSVEDYLATKAQTMLDNVLGYGNAMVQVNAEINFNQIEKTMELYDPESQVAVSEQTVKTENNGRTSGDSASQVSQNSTVNYEINKTVQRVIEGTGNILRLSVAAVINYASREVKKGNEVETVFEPRSQEQLDMLDQIIRNAVGFDEERQDQFSLVNISFETKPVEEINPEEPSIIENIDEHTDLIFIVVGLLGALFMLRSLLKRLKNEKQMLAGFENDMVYVKSPGTSVMDGKKMQQKIESKIKRELPPIEDIEDEISDEAVMKKRQQDKISNYVSSNPADAAKIINSWLHEEEFA
jgi:flagellar M-ring protein FliF